MFGLNVVLIGDFLIGFAVAWVLRGVCDRVEYKISHLFNKKGKANE